MRNNKHNIIIYRNHIPTQTLIKHLTTINNPILILSPNPNIPNETNYIPKLLTHLRNKLPIINIYLKHQTIIKTYKNYINQTNEILHNKTSNIKHNNQTIFTKLTNPLPITHYHSLINNNIPTNLTINTHFNNIIITIHHNTNHIYKFQFHPKSILTTQNTHLLKQTLT